VKKCIVHYIHISLFPLLCHRNHACSHPDHLSSCSATTLVMLGRLNSTVAAAVCTGAIIIADTSAQLALSEQHPVSHTVHVSAVGNLLNDRRCAAGPIPASRSGTAPESLFRPEAALLDRQFRLLREDFVGPLRAELSALGIADAAVHIESSGTAPSEVISSGGGSSGSSQAAAAAAASQGLAAAAQSKSTASSKLPATRRADWLTAAAAGSRNVSPQPCGARGVPEAAAVCHDQHPAAPMAQNSEDEDQARAT